MKSRQEVKQRLRQATYYHYKRFAKERLRPRPANCAHNYPNKVRGETVGGCAAHAVTGFLFCDDKDPAHNDRPSKCGQFTCRHNKETVNSEWAERIESVETLFEHGYRDIVMLMWVLESGESLSDVSEDSVPSVEPEPVFPLVLTDNPFLSVLWGMR